MSLNQPDLDLLADYVGGALDGTPDSERVGERIRSDAEWAEAYAELVTAFDAVSSDLHALGAEPEPMPQDVWDRLEAALSSPSLSTPTAAVPSQSPVFTAPRDNRPPSRAQARRRRWVVPVLAAVAVLFALSLGLVLTHPFTGAEKAATDTAAGGAPAPALAQPLLERASGRDYTDETLVLATDFGAVPLASRFYTSTQSQEGTTDTSKVPQPLESFASPVPSALLSLTAPDALARCLAAVSAIMPGQVLGVDFASYRGTPAAIIVVRTPDDGRWVGVAGANCGQSGAHLLAQKRLG